MMPDDDFFFNLDELVMNKTPITFQSILTYNILEYIKVISHFKFQIALNMIISCPSNR